MSQGRHRALACSAHDPFQALSCPFLRDRILQQPAPSALPVTLPKRPISGSTPLALPRGADSQTTAAQTRCIQSLPQFRLLCTEIAGTEALPSQHPRGQGPDLRSLQISTEQTRFSVVTLKGEDLPQRLRFELISFTLITLSDRRPKEKAHTYLTSFHSQTLQSLDSVAIECSEVVRARHLLSICAKIASSHCWPGAHNSLLS